MSARTFVVVALSLMLAGCSGGVSASGCHAAAAAQAEAENAYVAAIAAHDEAHAIGNDAHPDTDDETIARRIDLIIATEASAGACR